MFISIGVEDDWPLAELLLKAVRIQLRLLLAHAGVPLGSFRLYQPEWFPVVAPKHIIYESLALFVWHSRDREFPVSFLVKCPTSFLQEQVDKIITSLCLGIVVLIR